MSMFESEEEQLLCLSEAMRSTIDSGEAGNYADLWADQGDTLGKLLDELAAIAMTAPGGHQGTIYRASQWSAALRGEFK